MAAVFTQTVELIGGPRDGEIWEYQYAGNPVFDVYCEGDTGINYHYRMCSDGRFRLERHADDFEKKAKRAKRGK